MKMPEDCCGSCHHDQEDGYGYMSSVKYLGEDYEVCCAVSVKWIAFEKGLSND